MRKRRNGAAAELLAGARAHLWLSAPPSSGLVTVPVTARGTGVPVRRDLGVSGAHALATPASRGTAAALFPHGGGSNRAKVSPSPPIRFLFRVGVRVPPRFRFSSSGGEGGGAAQAHESRGSRVAGRWTGVVARRASGVASSDRAERGWRGRSARCTDARCGSGGQGSSAGGGSLPPPDLAPLLPILQIRRRGGRIWPAVLLQLGVPVAHSGGGGSGAAGACGGGVLSRASRRHAFGSPVPLRLGLPGAAPAVEARLRPTAVASTVTPEACLGAAMAVRGRAVRPNGAVAPVGFACLVETLCRRRRCSRGFSS